MLLNYLKLIRFQNLMVIVLTQYLVRYFLLGPILESIGFSLQLSDFQFSILVLTTILIAGAGYAVNDYYDVKTDRINKPERMVLVVKFRRRRAILIQGIMNVMAMGGGIYLSLVMKTPWLILVYLFATAFLWYYSAVLKRTFLLGNLTVAGLTSLVVLLVWLHEYAALKTRFPGDFIAYLDISEFILLFAGFSFLISLIREIIKDMEDLPGDSQVGCRTMAVVLGTKPCKKIVSALSVLMIGLIVWLQINWVLPLHLNYLLVYSTILIQMPMVIIIILTAKATTPKQFHFASLISKLVMLTGVLSMVLLKYTFFV
ncbi:MAG: geranylgeranylglycerol-phosphate geranylgeranyltransferase [Bacteroidetes bacterium]|nr:geranylgeranylglycerol-phosphate geranylgeranyltransferase [Bacteroidota bacterium]MBU1719559.1 geranylgeranylglycerol-phosphate geranylgeranyltransferase [Bacteroidota bacterium]